VYAPFRHQSDMDTELDTLFSSITWGFTTQGVCNICCKWPYHIEPRDQSGQQLLSLTTASWPKWWWWGGGVYWHCGGQYHLPSVSMTSQTTCHFWACVKAIYVQIECYLTCITVWSHNCPFLFTLNTNLLTLKPYVEASEC